MVFFPVVTLTGVVGAIIITLSNFLLFDIAFANLEAEQLCNTIVIGALPSLVFHIKLFDSRNFSNLSALSTTSLFRIILFPLSYPCAQMFMTFGSSLKFYLSSG